MTAQQQKDLAERFELACTPGAGGGPKILVETLNAWRDAIGEQVMTRFSGCERKLNEGIAVLDESDFDDCPFIPRFVLGETDGVEWMAILKPGVNRTQHTYEVEAI
jgi:hypothetical protein